MEDCVTPDLSLHEVRAFCFAYVCMCVCALVKDTDCSYQLEREVCEDTKFRGGFTDLHQRKHVETPRSFVCVYLLDNVNI